MWSPCRLMEDFEAQATPPASMQDNGSMKAISNIANHIFRHTLPTFRTQDSNGGNGLIRENQDRLEALEGTSSSAPKSASSRTVPSAEPSPHAISMAQKTTSRVFCAIDCPGRCPLVLELRDGELARVRANKAAPACHRGLSMRAWANSPDRLMWPRRAARVGAIRAHHLGRSA